MTMIEWLIVVLVLVILLALIRGRAPGAVGYTRAHGHCPNMGACDNCNVCEED